MVVWVQTTLAQGAVGSFRNYSNVKPIARLSLEQKSTLVIFLIIYFINNPLYNGVLHKAGLEVSSRTGTVISWIIPHSQGTQNQVQTHLIVKVTSAPTTKGSDSSQCRVQQSGLTFNPQSTLPAFPFLSLLFLSSLFLNLWASSFLLT